MKKSLSYLILAIVTMFLLSPIVYLQSPDKEKLLKKSKAFDPPIDIVKFKSKIGEIEPDKKFSTEDEDWLKGLTIKVQNNSGKPITYISYKLYIPNPLDPENLPEYGFGIRYGIDPISNKQGKVFYQRANPIKSGDFINLKITDEEYTALKDLLKKKNSQYIIKQATISIELIEFEDETLFLGGQLYKLDERNPKKLILLNPEKVKQFDFFFN